MTINTTKDLRPDTRSDAAIERPIASKAQLEAVVSHATSEPDLESRIKERRAELIRKLGELRVDMRFEAAEAREKLRSLLSELAHIIKFGVVDGWASIGGPVTHKLEQWLAGAARHLAAKHQQP
jgi:C4-dicarboxylate-specific signal transduction histidine kinase